VSTQSLRGLIDLSLTATVVAPTAQVEMKGKLVDDRDRWRERAEQARLRAEKISDERSKFRMLKLSEFYERMALRVEQRSRDANKLR